MNVDFRDFDRKVKVFTTKVTPEQVLTVQRSISLVALGQLTKRSPVDTGRFRASWTVAVTNPDISVKPPPTKAKRKSKTRRRASEFPAPNINEADSKLKAELVPYQIVYLNNSLPYSELLEQGSSAQAPQGVVATTVAFIASRFGQ